MVYDVLGYELLLVALLWLLVSPYWAWQRGRAVTHQAMPRPIKRPQRASADNPPFAGLTTKPRCDACEQADQHVYQPLPAPPPLLVSQRGRPRAVDTYHQYCPNPRCRYYGWVGRGNIRANGHPGGSPWRQLHCIRCQLYFLETYGTPLQGKRVPAERIVRVMATLAEGLGIRAVARVVEVDPNTVLAWLVEAADHLQAFSHYLLHDVHVSQVQLDELFALVSEVKAGQVSDVEAIQRLSRSPHWVWVAIDPGSKLLLAIEVGERTLEMARRLVHHVVQVLAPDCVPLLLTDGLKEYATALLTHFGHWVHPPRQTAQGPAPKPRWMPLPQLLYAQVVKTYRRRRVVHVSYRVVFGTFAGIKQVLEPWGWHINTAFIERVNLTIRQHVAAVGRRVMTLCKSTGGLRHQLSLYHTYYNFCVPHTSLRRPLAQPQPTNGTGSTKRWHPCTPALAAGLTDRVWSLRDVLLFRVPPWPQPAGR